MPFELHIAWRYLLAKRKQAFISLISLISMLGVAVGVTALVIALALMTGLQGELRDRILGSQRARVRVEAGRHRRLPRGGGEAAHRCRASWARRRRSSGKALLRTGRADAFITFKGIDPALEGSVTDLARSVEQGSLKALVQRPTGRLPAS